ncbi:ArsR family transcriptional regulator [Methanohalophilus sp. RSK]|uniref:ArsR/SmtB family transcription factor n=1 Tax=Methanohalophilus sp. RSK TaxID=2485783 RepID=UPI000F43E413|nr:metalloregulator ArsR/SmtB family transcription factor [Methanohalophilus sp. RSK]RNI14985.1 ArsR family transcriptional regulator [Methanohalophilus sp. RSK]
MIIPEPIKCEIEYKGGVDNLYKKMPPEDEFKRWSKIHHALSSPLRLKILYMVARQPLCVCIIKHILKVSDSKLSYHLSILSESGIIKGTREGNWIIYSATEEGKQMIEGISGK